MSPKRSPGSHLGAEKDFQGNMTTEQRPGRSREVSQVMMNNKCSLKKKKNHLTQNQLRTKEHLQTCVAPKPFNQDKFSAGDKP